MITDQNHLAQYHWGNATHYANSAKHALEAAAQALQPLGAADEGHEYAGRINDAFEHIRRAKNFADRALAEYAASDEAWEPVVEQCTLGL